MSKLITLILDLDDTLFPTRSIPASVFEPLFKSLDDIDHGYSQDEMTSIRDALWKFTFYEVAQKYQFPEEMKAHYMAQVDTMPLQFDISVYPDYPEVKALELPMILVTSGTTNVQQAKIDSLGIRHDFKKIHIDDRTVKPGGKERIFREILEAYGDDPGQFLVVGDNPDSEIQAAKALSIPWLHIDRSMAPDPASRRISSLDAVRLFL